MSIVSSSQNTISSNHSDLPASRLTGATPGGWVESINSPLIQEDGDNKMLKLRFDVSQYEPEEIVVKTVDNKLLVCVKNMNIVHVTHQRITALMRSAAHSNIKLRCNKNNNIVNIITIPMYLYNERDFEIGTIENIRQSHRMRRTPFIIHIAGVLY